jgi:hypothetical protein
MRVFDMGFRKGGGHSGGGHSTRTSNTLQLLGAKEFCVHFTKAISDA